MYLETTIDLILNIKNIRFEKIGDYISFGLSIAFATINTIAPIFIGFFLYMNRRSLDSPYMNKHFTEFTRHIKHSNIYSYAYFSCFMFKRVVFVAIIFGLSNYGTLQVLMMIVLNLCYVSYLISTMP